MIHIIILFQKGSTIKDESNQTVFSRSPNIGFTLNGKLLSSNSVWCVYAFQDPELCSRTTKTVRKLHLSPKDERLQVTFICICNCFLRVMLSLILYFRTFVLKVQEWIYVYASTQTVAKFLVTDWGMYGKRSTMAKGCRTMQPDRLNRLSSSRYDNNMPKSFSRGLRVWPLGSDANFKFILSMSAGISFIYLWNFPGQ